MLHPAIEARSFGTIHRTGLVATRKIAAGTVVWELDEPTYTMEQIRAWPEARRRAFKWYGFQCGHDRYSLPEGLSRDVNHSCDPNTWWVNNHALAARRDIEADEEVTYDYATCDIDLAFSMKCSCGAADCRGVITNRDYLDLGWQKRYGAHLPEHVLAAIAASRARDAS